MLNLLGKIYGVGADLRNTFYDRGIFKTHSLGAKTISVGNLTTGGTGKTPLVAYIAELLAASGEKVCILTRGYGRDSSGRVLVSNGEEVLVDARTGGDEPVELARKLIGKAIIVADADRVAAAAWAKEEFGVTAFVLDDGFQHRRARRDLDIVCVDTTSPLRFARMLPGGNLREPLSNLDRADVIVLTRAELAASTKDFIRSVRDLNPGAPIFRAEALLRRLRTLDAYLAGRSNEETQTLTKQTLAFCGLGNPQPFMEMLAKEGTTLIKPFDDHHRYTQSDIEQIEETAQAYRSNALVTTAKDAVKLDGLTFEIPCLVAELEVVIDDPDGFRDLVISS
ncbi:MAG: tetraacyldisaccharide 4'-kinase [Acidobacteriota bacterium]